MIDTIIDLISPCITIIIGFSTAGLFWNLATKNMIKNITTILERKMDILQNYSNAGDESLKKLFEAKYTEYTQYTIDISTSINNLIELNKNLMIRIDKLEAATTKKSSVVQKEDK